MPEKFTLPIEQKIFPHNLQINQIPADQLELCLKLATQDHFSSDDIITCSETAPPSIDISTHFLAQRAYLFALYELWELTQRDITHSPEQQQSDWENVREDHLRSSNGPWLTDNLTGEIIHTLPETDFQTVRLSRLFPLFSLQETLTLQKANILFLGLSTNSPIIMDLIRCGLGSAIGVDPDITALSNTSRMEANAFDTGNYKAIVVGHQASRINPFGGYTWYPRPLTDDELLQVIKQSDCVIEMTDHLPLKNRARLFAKQEGKYVFMGTGTDVHPLLHAEDPNSPFFNRPYVTNELLNQLTDPNANPIDRLAGVINIIGRNNLSDRQMINFILGAKGEQTFLAQHGLAADGVAFGLSYMIIQHLNGRQVLPSARINLPKLTLSPGVQKAADQQLFQELCEKYPRIFNKSQNTLADAVATLSLDIWGEKINTPN